MTNQNKGKTWYEVKDDVEKKVEEKEKKDINGWVVVFVVIAIIAAYLAYEWYALDNGGMPDCAYTDRGCQGYDNRWGM